MPRSIQFLMLVLLPALAVSCTRVGPEVAPEPRSPIFAMLEGLWNWADRGCNNDPFTLSAAPDGSTITLAYSTPDSTGNPKPTIYRVLEQGPEFVRAQITDESRRTDDGRLVVWDFVLLSPDAFCWRRTDWRSTGCTKPVQRCERRIARLFRPLAPQVHPAGGVASTTATGQEHRDGYLGTLPRA